MLPRTISSRKINIIFASKTIIANKLLSLTCLRLRRTSPIVSLLSFNTFLPRLSGFTVPQQRKLHSTFKPWLSQYNHIRHQSTMATARKVHLSPETDSGVFNSAVRQDTAQAASEALQLDMEKHHVFFNDRGYHSTNSGYPELALYYLDNLYDIDFGNRSHPAFAAEHLRPRWITRGYPSGV